MSVDLSSLEKIKKINSDIEKLFLVLREFNSKIEKNLNNNEKPNWNLFNKFTIKQNSFEFRRIHSYIFNKWKQISDSIWNQITILSELVPIKQNILILPQKPIFKFLFPISIFQFLDSIICMNIYWNRIKDFCDQKKNLLDIKEKIEKEIKFETSQKLKFISNKYDKYIIFFNLIQKLRNNLIHPYSTYSRHNLLKLPNEYSEFKETLPSIQLFNFNESIEDLFLIKVTIATRINKDDGFQGYSKNRIIDLFSDCWQPFFDLSKIIFEDTLSIFN